MPLLQEFARACDNQLSVQAARQGRQCENNEVDQFICDTFIAASESHTSGLFVTREDIQKWAVSALWRVHVIVEYNRVAPLMGSSWPVIPLAWFPCAPKCMELPHGHAKRLDAAMACRSAQLGGGEGVGGCNGSLTGGSTHKLIDAIHEYAPFDSDGGFILESGV